MSDSEDEITERQFKVRKIVLFYKYRYTHIFILSICSKSNRKFQLYISTDLSNWTLTSWQNINSKSIYNRYIYKELCCNCWGRILLKKDCFTRKSSCNLKGVSELALYFYHIIKAKVFYQENSNIF